MNILNKDVNVIFFDAGGVLFDTLVKGERRVTNLMMQRGFAQSEIVTAIHKASQLDLPFITNWKEEEQYYKNYYGAIAEHLGEKKLEDELMFFAHYAVNCELFPEVKEVLETLSKTYRLAVISNAMPSMDWIFDRLGIRHYFEAIILSSTVLLEKPNEAVYYLALKELSASKEESVFIDDKMENIDGSERAGIKGLYLNRSKSDLMELLKDHKLWPAV
ncbi:HAD family hydrolase [Psychrobacillus sp. FSL K6-2843]|uniref:HAD family hydrolase n=1 Tax=Psychrobacillus sp. FSL K6-2843 TaxID=2921549 RepID=UPI00315B10C2